MKTFSISLPDSIDLDTRDIKILIASKLYEQGKLSLGEASDIIGVSKRTFIELLGIYGVSVFNYEPSEIEEDFHNA